MDLELTSTMKVTSESVGLLTYSSPMTTFDCTGGSLGGMGFRAWIFSASWFSAPAGGVISACVSMRGLRPLCLRLRALGILEIERM